MQGQDDTSALRRYRLIAEIGHGGMADVFLAVAQGPAGFNKLVVIKKTRKDLLGEADVLAMFLDEARLAARLNHPNVVQTYEIGRDEDRYFIAMEYLDGQPLHRVLSRCGDKIPLTLKLRILIEVLAGLHHAHELRDFDGTALGVVHRDATPQNVFITYDGSIKVVDFGIAKARDSSSHTRTGVVKGKVGYMAPEQVRGERIDRRTDIFAVGVMLWEAIAGQRMWRELPEITVVHELIHNLVPSILTASPHIPPELVMICDRALAPAREHRYATAQELAQDLEDYLVKTGERATARDVGRFLAESFTADREKVRAIIEKQLRDVHWTNAPPRSTGGDLPSIAVASGVYAQQPSSFRDADTATVDTGPRRHKIESPPTETDPVEPPPPGSSNIPALPFVQAATTAPTNSGAALSTVMPRPPSKTALAPVIAAGLITVLGGVAFVKLMSHAPTPTAPSAPAPTAEAAAPTNATAARDDNVHVKIRVKPENATLSLDTTMLPLTGGAFDRKMLRSDTAQLIRAEAPGFKPSVKPVVFSGDVDMTIELERDEAAAPATAQAEPKRQGGAKGHGAVASPASTGDAKPHAKHDIDPDSPYAKPQ